MTGRRGATRARRTAAGDLEVYLQMPPGESLIVAVTSDAARDRFESYRPAGAPVGLENPWTVRFLEGGPALPSERTIARLVSWTQLEDGEAARSFSGTAMYSTTFARPPGNADRWRLDLGGVHEIPSPRPGDGKVPLLIDRLRAIGRSIQHSPMGSIERPSVHPAARF